MSPRPRLAAGTPGTGQESLELRLLGPLEVRRSGEPLPLGGSRPRALLALLSLQRGTVASVDRIVDELWGDPSPRSARHMVAVYVSKLRKTLGDGILITSPPGYVLEVAAEQVDAERFERLLREGQDALAHGDAVVAARELGDALGLWRGPALADFAYEPFTQADIARLEELRLIAEEELIEAELALGTNKGLVGELEELVARAPLRERRHAQLMLALYRAGRQADALAAYRQAREVLVEGLGVEPGRELRKLEQAMLAQEEWLAGAPLARRERALTPATRRVITVFFAEFAAGGPDADLEAREPLAERLLGRAETILERHGAAVERLPDGTLMGIFGTPAAHEDDALRSLRAAADLREVGVVFRAGMDTGEVLTGSNTRVSGPAVRAAAHLLATASPGEVLVGEATRQLAAHAAHFAALVSNGATAWRLLDLMPDAPVRPLRMDVALVGREMELAALRAEFTETVRERRPKIVTVIGEPGIGKSRLARALCEELEDKARVVSGRCPAYGEGITYWPLREVMGELAGEETTEALTRLAESTDDPEGIRRRLEAAVGLLDEAHPVEEIQWAARMLFESLARERPLLLVFEDLHWAESTFLDLLEHVVKVGEDAPIHLLCMARPEFLERHQDWEQLGGRASRLSLHALTAVEAVELVSRIDSGALSEDRRKRVIEVAEGNPLFLEQLTTFALESAPDGDALDLPPTLRALLAARLERLGPGERAVLHCAAVAGREFPVSAVTELLPIEARGMLPRHLEKLTRKGFTEPKQSSRPFEIALRFRHALLQEAAYRSLPKEQRAQMHERLALWFAQRPESAADELVGYHLEQAHRYRTELGPEDDHGRALARQAAERLAAAAQRALNRGDRPAQVNLLSRSLELLPVEDAARLELLPELGTTLTSMGDFARAEVVLAEAIVAAANDAPAGARARIARADLRATSGAESFPSLRREAERAIRVLQKLGDDVGLAKGWAFLAWNDHVQGHEVAAQEEWERSIEHARRAGRRWDEIEGLTQLVWIAVWGPTPRVDALRRCEQNLEAVKGHPGLEAPLLGALSCLRALEGRFDDARALVARRAETLHELGLALEEAWASWSAGWVELLAGDAAAAEGVLRPSYERLEEAGATGYLQIVGSHLAQAVCMQGRFEEAERLALLVEHLDPTSVAEVADARRARAKAVARLGRTDEGERLARAAVALIDRTEFLIDRADARMDLAEVLLVAGRSHEAAQVLEKALHLHEDKGNLVSAERARALLTELER